MFLNTAQFPIVRLHFDQKDSRPEDDSFGALEALLDRKTPFVIIGEGQSGHRHEWSGEGRAASWSIARKSRLRAFMKAMIYIEPSAARRRAMRPLMRTFERFWGCPMVVIRSEPEALMFGRALLDAYAAAG